MYFIEDAVLILNLTSLYGYDFHWDYSINIDKINVGDIVALLLFQSIKY